MVQLLSFLTKYETDFVRIGFDCSALAFLTIFPSKRKRFQCSHFLIFQLLLVTFLNERQLLVYSLRKVLIMKILDNFTSHQIVLHILAKLGSI